jgi:hypothetical protein
VVVVVRVMFSVMGSGVDRIYHKRTSPHPYHLNILCL